MRGFIFASVLLSLAASLICNDAWCTPTGLEADGQGHLWISDDSNGSISRVNEMTGDVEFAFTPFASIYSGTPFGNNRIRDLTWDGSHIWAAYWTDPMLVTTHPSDINVLPSAIYEFDPSTGQVLDKIAAPFSGHPDGLSWDGSALTIGEENDGASGHIYRVDPTTKQVLSSFNIDNGSPGSSNPRGLTWDSGSLWVGLQGIGEIRKYDTNGNVLVAFDSPFGAYQQDLTIDGQFLWATGSCCDQLAKIDLKTGKVAGYLSITAVPEPNSLASILLGLLVLIAASLRMPAARSKA